MLSVLFWITAAERGLEEPDCVVHIRGRLGHKSLLHQRDVPLGALGFCPTAASVAVSHVFWDMFSSAAGSYPLQHVDFRRSQKPLSGN